MATRSSGISMGTLSKSWPMGPVSIGTLIRTLPKSIRRGATKLSIFTAKDLRSTPKMANARPCKLFYFGFAVRNGFSLDIQIGIARVLL